MRRVGNAIIIEDARVRFLADADDPEDIKILAPPGLMDEALAICSGPAEDVIYEVGNETD